MFMQAIKNTIKSTLGFGFLLILIAAGAVVAEPPLPELSFFMGDKLLTTRPMTTREHTLYLKMKHAIHSVGYDSTVEDIKKAKPKIAADSLQIVAQALRNDAEDSGDDNDKHRTQRHEYSYSSIAESIADGVTEIAKFAERIGKATNAFEQEVRKNADGLAYDHVTIGEGENLLTLI